jgi:hypothetical protein
MAYLIALLCLALVGCAVTIYRLSGDKHDLVLRIKEHETQRHYLKQRNDALNAELLTASVRTTYTGTQTHSTGTPPAPVLKPLPTEHPQKRRPKPARGKKK